jgi:hypothetical protein
MGDYETIIHSIRYTLDLHPQLGYSLTRCGKRFQFNVKKGRISKTLCKSGNFTQFIPFVHAFYAFESPLYYSH